MKVDFSSTDAAPAARRRPSRSMRNVIACERPASGAAASCGTCTRTGTQRACAGPIVGAASLADHRDAGQALDRDGVALRALGRVHDLQAVDVLDLAVVDDARQRAAVAHHVDLERARAAPGWRRTPVPIAPGSRRRPARAGAARGASICARRPAARPCRSRWRSGSARAGSPSCPSRSSQASMQAAQPMHSYCRPLRMSMPVGHTCTHSVQSMQSPRPALRADRRLARARAARLAARGVVADDQRVAVEHRALEARVRAHVLADLLAHEAGVAVGGEAVEQDPERSPTARARAAGDSTPAARGSA